MKSPEECEAIEAGTTQALLDVLDAAGHYPMTRTDIIDAIREGVRDAVANHLANHPIAGSLPNTAQREPTQRNLSEISEHVTYLAEIQTPETAGTVHVAMCGCGWEGEHWPSEADASADADTHRAIAEAYPS